MPKTDEKKVFVCFRVRILDDVADILNRWLAKFGKNVSDSKVNFAFEGKDGFCVYFSYYNWLTGDDAKEIDESLVEIAFEKSSCAGGKLKLVTAGA